MLLLLHRRAAGRSSRRPDPCTTRTEMVHGSLYATFRTQLQIQFAQGHERSRICPLTVVHFRVYLHLGALPEIMAENMAPHCEQCHPATLQHCLARSCETGHHTLEADSPLRSRAVTGQTVIPTYVMAGGEGQASAILSITRRGRAAIWALRTKGLATVATRLLFRHRLIHSTCIARLVCSDSRH